MLRPNPNKQIIRSLARLPYLSVYDRNQPLIVTVNVQELSNYPHHLGHKLEAELAGSRGLQACPRAGDDVEIVVPPGAVCCSIDRARCRRSSSCFSPKGSLEFLVSEEAWKLTCCKCDNGNGAKQWSGKLSRRLVQTRHSGSNGMRSTCAAVTTPPNAKTGN